MFRRGQINYWVILALFLLTVGFFFVGSVHAAGTGIGSALGNLKTVVEPNTGLSSDLAGTLGIAIKTILSLVGTLFLGLMIYAGILWMTAAGREEKVEKAKKIVEAAIIGLVITMSAYAITYFVTAKLEGAVPVAKQAEGKKATEPEKPQVCCEQCEGDVWGAVDMCDAAMVDQGTCETGKAGCPSENQCRETADPDWVEVCKGEDEIDLFGD